MILLKSNPNSIEIVANAINENKVVIIPTDTVYGFSGIVPNSDALIRKIKGRNEVKPFIQLVSHPDVIKKYSSTVIPKSVLKHMPGAITVIVKNNHDEGTTAFRCPDDAWLQNLLQLCKEPIYSTSTNRSGCPILTTIQEIENEFSDEVHCIIDGEISNNEEALPSTIVDISKGDITIIRKGSVII